MVMLSFGVSVVIRFTIPVCRFGRKIILDVLFANKIGSLPVLPDDSNPVSHPQFFIISNKLQIITSYPFLPYCLGVNISSGYQFHGWNSQ